MSLALEAHVAELRAAVDADLAETAPPIRPLRRYTEAQVDEIAERYQRGDSTVTIGADLGIPIRQVGNLLERRGIARRPSSVPHKHPAPEERVCARNGCDEKFTPTGYQVARGWGRFCSRACARAASRVAEPEERICARKGCGKTFTRMPSEAIRPGHGRFCSHRCRQLYFWRKEEARVAGIIKSLEERGLLKGQGRQRIFGRLGGSQGAKHGIEGFHRGQEGGAPPKATPTEVKEVWRLWRENETLPKPERRSPYRISELVFGERRYHMRVRRLLGIS